MRIVSTLIALALVLTACSRDKADFTDDGRVIIDLWTYWAGFEREALDEAVEKFNTSQKRIFVKALGIADPKTKIMLATASGHPPDLALLPYYSISAFADNNALTPLNGLADAYGIHQDAFLPTFWEGCSYRGFLWGMPLTASVTALHYNKTAFREAGLDPDAPPETLQQLEAFNDLITRYRDDGSLLRIGHHPTQPGWWRTSWPRWFGGEAWDGSRKMLIDTDQWVDAANWLKSYRDRFGADKLTRLRSGFGKFASPQNPFFSGKAAMIHQGIWMDNFVNQYAQPDFEYGVAPFPAAEGSGQAFTSIAEPDNMIIPRGAKHPQEAFEFLAFLVQQEIIEELSIKHKKLTPLRSVSADFFERHPHPYIAEFQRIAASPFCVNRVQIPHYQQFQSEITEAIDAILQGRALPKEALAAAQTKQQATLEKQLQRWNRVETRRTAEWQAINDDLGRRAGRKERPRFSEKHSEKKRSEDAPPYL